MYQKRHRTTFNHFQLAVLEEAFRSNIYPCLSQREALALHTALDVSRVQVWFQNRRAKYKKQVCQAMKCLSASQNMATTSSDKGQLKQSAIDWLQCGHASTSLATPAAAGTHTHLGQVSPRRAPSRGSSSCERARRAVATAAAVVVATKPTTTGASRGSPLIEAVKQTLAQQPTSQVFVGTPTHLQRNGPPAPLRFECDAGLDASAPWTRVCPATAKAGGALGSVLRVASLKNHDYNHRWSIFESQVRSKMDHSRGGR